MANEKNPMAAKNGDAIRGRKEFVMGSQGVWQFI